MSTSRHTVSGWLRLCATLVAALGLMARIAAPLPAEASDPRSDLMAIGAALCHSGDGSTDRSPADPATCDHCPMCAVAHGAVFLPPPVGAGLPERSMAGVEQPRWVTVAALSRAQPERANPPRAPPIV